MRRHSVSFAFLLFFSACLWSRYGEILSVHLEVLLGTAEKMVSKSEAGGRATPNDVTELVYAEPPYAARGPKDTENLADAVDRGMTPLVAISETDDGYEARLTVTVAG